MRTRCPDRAIAPTRSASTCNSRPIAGSGFFAGAYCIADVREMMSRPPICARSVVSEPVTAARQRFDEPRILGRVAQGFAQLSHGAVQSDIEIDERVGRPELLLQLLARHHSSGALEQQPQNLKGLVRKPDLQAMPAQLARLRVELEDPEPEDSRRRARGFHGPLVVR